MLSRQTVSAGMETQNYSVLGGISSLADLATSPVCFKTCQKKKETTLFWCFTVKYDKTFSSFQPFLNSVPLSGS